MPDKLNNVFISHVHEDDAGLKNLKNLVASRGNLVRDYSITSDKFNNATNEDYIKREILGPRIKSCSALIVYITPGTKDSAWVNWEIEFAHKAGLKIIGVWERGSHGCELPDNLEKYHDAVVGWNGTSIVDALNNEFVGYEKPDGTPAAPREIRRIACQ